MIEKNESKTDFASTLFSRFRAARSFLDGPSPIMVAYNVFGR